MSSSIQFTDESIPEGDLCESSEQGRVFRACSRGSESFPVPCRPTRQNVTVQVCPVVVMATTNEIAQECKALNGSDTRKGTGSRGGEFKFANSAKHSGSGQPLAERINAGVDAGCFCNSESHRLPQSSNTKAIGKGTRNFAVNFEQKEIETLLKRACEQSKSGGAYIKELILAGARQLDPQLALRIEQFREHRELLLHGAMKSISAICFIGILVYGEFQKSKEIVRPSRSARVMASFKFRGKRRGEFGHSEEIQTTA